MIVIGARTTTVVATARTPANSKLALVLTLTTIDCSDHSHYYCMVLVSAQLNTALHQELSTACYSVHTDTEL
jgi:hypothetical protein